MTKKENISLMKTIAILLVVLYHSIMFYSGNWFTIFNPKIKFNNSIFSIINNFQMPIFVFCSGYLFYLKGNKQCSIKKRFKRLIVPYIFTSILYVIPISIIFFKYSAIQIIYKYFLGFEPSQLWFLLMMFWLYIIGCITNNKINFTKKNIFIVAIICPIISYILSKCNILQIGTAFSYFPFYFFGGYISKQKITEKSKKAIIYTLMVIIINLIIIKVGHKQALQYRFITKYLQLLTSCLEVFIFYLLTLNFKGTCNKIYRTVESNSFGIYLFHQQIIYFCLYLTRAELKPPIQITLNFTVALVLSTLLTIMLKKNKHTKRMFGL